MGFFQVSLHFHMHNMMHMYKVNKPTGVKKKNIHTVKCMQGLRAVLYTSVDSTLGMSALKCNFDRTGLGGKV